MPPCCYYIIYHEIVINASFLGLSATLLCAAPFPSAHRMMNHVIFRLMYSPLKKPARQKMEIQLKGAAAQSMLITAINPVHQARLIDWFCTNVLCTSDCNKKKRIKIQPFLLIPCDFSKQRTSAQQQTVVGRFWSQRRRVCQAVERRNISGVACFRCLLKHCAVAVYAGFSPVWCECFPPLDFLPRPPRVTVSSFSPHISSPSEEALYA